MAYQLVAEVFEHAPADLTPGELVVLLAIAERANHGTRKAIQVAKPVKKQVRWVLNERVRLSPTGLRTVLQRLRARGLEVREQHGTDAAGRPMFAHRGLQTTYILPCFGDATASPISENGDATASPNDGENGDATASNGDALASDGDASASPKKRKGDATASPSTSLPSGTRQCPPDGGRERSTRMAPPRDEHTEEQQAPGAARAAAMAVARAARKGKPPTPMSAWAKREPAGPNPHYDPDAAKLLEAQATDPEQEPIEETS